MAENLQEVFDAARSDGADPGLRHTYPSLPRAPIRLIVPPMGKAINQGGLLRVAEAFRLERVDFEPEPDRMTDFSGGAGIWDYQPMRWIPASEAIAEAKRDGLTVYALTLSERSIPVRAVQWAFPAAIVVGEEKQGLAPEVEAACDASVAIPLFGLVTSINVVSACAICVESAVHAYRASNPEFVPARGASRSLLGRD